MVTTTGRSKSYRIDLLDYSLASDARYAGQDGQTTKEFLKRFLCFSHPKKSAQSDLFLHFSPSFLLCSLSSNATTLLSLEVDRPIIDGWSSFDNEDD